MSTARKRILSLALVVCLLLGMTLAVPGPVTVSADVGIADGQPPDITVCETVIGFAGHQWVVIGDEFSGVSTGDSKYITLLLEKDDTGFSSIAFRQRDTGDQGGWTLYGGFYYEGSFTTFPNEYSDSTLHSEMERIATSLQSSSAKEYGLIVGRNIADGIGGNLVGSQGLWPLSEQEYYDVWDATRVSNQSEILSFSGDWWLRSADISGDDARVVSASGSPCILAIVNDSRGVRPAFQLNLESVIFTSDASGASKSTVAVGDPSLSAAKPPSDEIKLTVKDDVNLGLNITSATTITAASGDTVNIEYDSASTGANHSVSVIIANSSGKPLYYGRPGDCSSSDSGTASFDLPAEADLPEGDYKLMVFNEEVRGANETDFASTPEVITLTVSNPTAAELKVDDVTFDPLPLGYSQPAAKDIIIENEGGADATITDVSVSDITKFTVIPHSNTTVPAGDNNTDWQVQPEEGLGVGTHSATITVTYTGGVSDPLPDTATAQVEFEVQAAPPVPGTPTLTATPTNLGFGNVTADTASSPQSVTVSGTDLTGDISYTFTGDTNAFSLGTSGWSNTSGGALEVTFEPADVRDYSAALTFSSAGASDISVTLTGSGTTSGGNGGGNGDGGDQTGRFTITFDPRGGTVTPSTATTGTDGRLSSLPTSTRSGYTFEGWYTQINGGGTKITTGYQFAADTTVYAHWTVNSGSTPGGSSSGGGSSSSGSSTPDSQVAKTQLPASAFAWDGDRTLTITHDNITALGLLSVQWNGQTLTRGTDFTAHQGSVIIRFGEDFMAARSSGSHTVRVEFLNHYGETTVTVGATGAAGDGPATSTGGTDNPDTGGDGGEYAGADGPNYNPNTGGYFKENPMTGDVPQTGDQAPLTGLWLTLLLGSMGGMALAIWRWRKARHTNA